MSELGDVPLDKSGSATSDGDTPEPDSPALLPRLLVGLLLGVLVGLGYVVWRSQAPASPAPVAAATAPVPNAASADPAAVAPAVVLPPLEESDSAVRDLLGPASSHPSWRSWLTLDDLVRRFTAAVTNLAAGDSPTAHLRALAPKGPFAVRRSGSRLVIDPATYSRYDALADVIGSTDTAALATAYKNLKPLFEAARRELGETTAIDATMAGLGKTIVSVPVIDQPIEVHEQGAVYAFAEAKLEERSAAEKHLLRLGPRNLRIIQAKVKDLLAAAGLRPES